MKATFALLLTVGAALGTAQSRDEALRALLVPPRPDYAYARVDPQSGRAFDAWVLESLASKTGASRPVEAFTDAVLLAEVAPDRAETAFERAVDTLKAMPSSTDRNGCLALGLLRLGLPNDAALAAAEALRTGDATYWPPLIRGATALYQARAPFESVLQDPNLSVRDRINALSMAYAAARNRVDVSIGELTSAARLAPESVIVLGERMRAIEALGTSLGSDAPIVPSRNQLTLWIEDARKRAVLTTGPLAFRARAAATYLSALVMRYADPKANGASLVLPAERSRFARALTDEDLSALKLLASDLAREAPSAPAAHAPLAWRLIALMRLATDDAESASRALGGAAVPALLELRAGLAFAQDDLATVISSVPPGATAVSLRYLRASALARSGKTAEGQAALGELLASNPEHLRATIAFAIIRARNGGAEHLEEAAQLLERLYAVQPEDEALRDDAVFALALVCGLRGEVERAERLLSSVRDRTLAGSVELARKALRSPVTA